MLESPGGGPPSPKQTVLLEYIYLQQNMDQLFKIVSENPKRGFSPEGLSQRASQEFSNSDFITPNFSAVPCNASGVN
jgi:hypothetical protein